MKLDHIYVYSKDIIVRQKWGLDHILYSKDKTKTEMKL